MAYFALNTSDRLSLQNSLIDAMQQCGMEPAVLYNVAGTLVWTFNRSAKVQKMTLNNDAEKRPAFYYGDSHTGGGNLSNQVMVTGVPGGEAFGNWWFVANADACAIVIKSNVSYATMFWAKADTNELIGLLDSGIWASASVRYVPTGAAIYLSGAPYFGSFLLKNSSGAYYYSCDIFVVDSGGKLLHASVGGLKWLCRDRSYVAGLEVYGNDVVLTGGTPDLPVGWVAPTLYMPGGASWSP